ncbi:MAG: Uma2 family endonuclease [Chloroflexota bacterium]|nr:Uma2 family endonuclease [Chloroflexota bacterium]
MASETQTRPYPLPHAATVWPPDDTEESVLGTDLHQTTITNLRWGVNEIARLYRLADGTSPWRALSQMALLGCMRADGTLYRMYPDIFVYPRPIDPSRGSLTLAADGPPVLIIEVLSESTYEVDLDLPRGKGYSYAHAGVPEYLALDPTGQFMPERIRAWRLVEGVYQPWEQGANGHWRSKQIAVEIGLEGVRATVYAHDGRRMLHEGEVAEELRRRDEELGRRDEELQQARAELEQLRHELDERKT